MTAKKSVAKTRVRALAAKSQTKKTYGKARPAGKAPRVRAVRAGGMRARVG